MINIVFTMFSSQKSHAVLLTAPIFASFCVCNTDFGERGAVAIAAFLPLAVTAPHPNFPLKYPSLMAVGKFAYRSVGNSAHRL
jgi:hypothetical protein